MTQPDLIITDIEMPEMSGDKVMEQIKEDPSTKHIPVIIVTVHDRDSLPVQRAIAAGAAKVLYKPTSPKVIEDEVRRFLFP
jgi:CheY-like chemotaxis protein